MRRQGDKVIEDIRRIRFSKITKQSSYELMETKAAYTGPTRSTQGPLDIVYGLQLVLWWDSWMGKQAGFWFLSWALLFCCLRSSNFNRMFFVLSYYILYYYYYYIYLLSIYLVICLFVLYWLLSLRRLFFSERQKASRSWWLRRWGGIRRSRRRENCIHIILYKKRLCLIKGKINDFLVFSEIIIL